MSISDGADRWEFPASCWCCQVTSIRQHVVPCGKRWSGANIDPSGCVSLAERWSGTPVAMRGSFGPTLPDVVEWKILIPRNVGLAVWDSVVTLQRPMGLFYIEHVRPLDRGGLGTVDVVRICGGDAYPIGTEFARKRLGPKWANDPGAQARFDREIEMLGSMSHSNIVICKGHNLPGAERYYLMPLFPRSLRKLLMEHAGAITRGWVVEFGIKVASALSYAHSLNHIHRDLKPENILMTTANEPVIADWGLGQFIHQHSKVLDLQTHGPMGTPYYCPLEQWNTGRCEPSGDVYSLGLILAEMAKGLRLSINPPFSGIRQDVVANDSAGATMFNLTVKKMTHMQAKQRHASMDDVILDLTNCY